MVNLGGAARNTALSKSYKAGTESAKNLLNDGQPTPDEVPSFSSLIHRFYFVNEHCDETQVLGWRTLLSTDIGGQSWIEVVSYYYGATTFCSLRVSKFGILIVRLFLWLDSGVGSR